MNLAMIVLLITSRMLQAHPCGKLNCGVQAVEKDSKQRFGLKEENGALYIRAVQGHTIKVTTLFVLIVDDLLWQIFIQYFQFVLCSRTNLLQFNVTIIVATEHLIDHSCILQAVESEHLLHLIADPSEVPGEFLTNIVICILLIEISPIYHIYLKYLLVFTGSKVWGPLLGSLEPFLTQML